MPVLLWVGGIVLLVILLSEAKEYLDRSTEDQAFEYLNRIRKTRRDLYEKLVAQKGSLGANARKNLDLYLLKYDGNGE